MGANMVRGCKKMATQCVVFDRTPATVQQLAGEVPLDSTFTRRLCSKTAEASGHLAHGPAAVVDASIMDLLPKLESGDILIDGGNSYLHRRHSPRQGTQTRRAFTTWTWAPVAAFGDSSAATAR
jgi:6-phosphogluconate dehydrogenase